MADETTQLFLEDFTKGQTFSSPPRTITETDVLGFAALTGDAHPLHYDDEYAKTTRFGRPIGPRPAPDGAYGAWRRAACPKA